MLHDANLAVYPSLNYIVRGNVTRKQEDVDEMLILRTVRAEISYRTAGYYLHRA